MELPRFICRFQNALHTSELKDCYDVIPGALPNVNEMMELPNSFQSASKDWRTSFRKRGWRVHQCRG